MPNSPAPPPPTTVLGTDTDAAPTVPDQFTVHNDKTANWIVRRIVEARAYAQRAKQWAEDEQNRARREEQFFLYRFGPQMQRWLEQELAQRGGHAKSISLPAGRLGLRHCGPKIEVLDQATVLDWARTNCPEAIKLKETVLKTPLTDHLQATGELPDGVILHNEMDVFYIR